MQTKVNSSLLIQLIVPGLAGLAFYLIVYIFSYFSKMDFSWILVLLFVLNSYACWWITARLLKAKFWGMAEGWKALLALFACGLLIELEYLPLKAYAIYSGNEEDTISLYHIASTLTIGLLMGSLAVGINLWLRYQQRWKSAVVKAAKLEKQASVAQLEALQQHIDPHFLFNNLNTLYQLIRENPAKAENFILEFTELYRYILDQRKQELVLLDQELALAEVYGRLLNQRFGEAFSLKLQVDAQARHSCHIPPLALQTLIENAVKHNRLSKAEPLEVIIRKEGQYLVTENPFQPHQLQLPSHKSGLENLAERFRLLGLEMQLEKNEEVFRVKLPLTEIESYAVADY